MAAEEAPGPRDAGAHAPPPPPVRTSLGELAALFLKLGTTAFGGPAAHVAMMEDEVVRRRGWLPRQAFLDLVGATNLIPGPNSTELAIHVGYARGGWRGLLVAGVCFILPAALIVATLAAGYRRFGTLPELQGVLWAVRPVVLAVVLQALWSLGRTAVRTRGLAVLGVLSVVAVAAGVHELAVLAAAGAATVLARRRRRPGGRGAAAMLVPGALGTLGGAAAPASVASVASVASAGSAASATLGGLFWVFARIGAVLFGSGYVLLAFLRTELVERRGWLTEPQLLDAVAVGQVTPGPVFTTATFIGYLLAGPAGAVAATLGIFLPAFLFVAASAPFLPRLRRSATAGDLLDGLNVASLALMAVVTVQLGAQSLRSPAAVGLALVAALLLLRWRVNSAWLVLGAAALGAASGLL